MKAISLALANKRTQLGLSQHDMAELVNMPYASYVRYERGDTVPSLNRLVALCKGAKISLDGVIQLEIALEDGTVHTSAEGQALVTAIEKLGPEWMQYFHTMVRQLERMNIGTVPPSVSD